MSWRILATKAAQLFLTPTAGVNIHRNRAVLLMCHISGCTHKREAVTGTSSNLVAQLRALALTAGDPDAREEDRLMREAAERLEAAEGLLRRMLGDKYDHVAYCNLTRKALD